MVNVDQITQMIEEAAAKVGSQNKLARILGIAGPNLTEMKQGKRPANWRIRGKLRAVLGEDPATAFVSAMAEDLARSDDEEEKKAAIQLAAMVEAFAGAGGSGGIRTLDGAQHPILP